MWDNLSPADLEQAKQHLKSRREETLLRHAEELRGLDSEQAGIDTLDRLIGAFTEKFKKAMTSSSEPGAIEGAEEPTLAEVNGPTEAIIEAKCQQSRPSSGNLNVQNTATVPGFRPAAAFGLRPSLIVS